MMTIDELRARKRELLARKRHELELQARGEGDNLALFMVREELGDVNDQLRALTAAAVHGLDLLTPRQRELLELYLSGRNIPQIAGDLGVNKSSVSRSIAKAKKKPREEAERAMTPSWNTRRPWTSWLTRRIASWGTTRNWSRRAYISPTRSSRRSGGEGKARATSHSRRKSLYGSGGSAGGSAGSRPGSCSPPSWSGGKRGPAGPCSSG